jgi:hypothetical protein
MNREARIVQKICKPYGCTGALAVNIIVFICAMLTSKLVTEFKDEMGRAYGTHMDE